MFSQFVVMLDVIEDFLTDKGFGFERLDGSTTSVGCMRLPAILFSDCQYTFPRPARFLRLSSAACWWAACRSFVRFPGDCLPPASETARAVPSSAELC